jgi:hypothetical protein
MTENDVQEMRPIAEVHKELIAKAEANAKANADAHAEQVKENNKFMQGVAKLNQAQEEDEKSPAKPTTSVKPQTQPQK